MDWLTVKLDDELHIVDVVSAKSSGLAHQKALEFTDAGYRAKVVPPEDASEVTFLWDQVAQKREMGFIEEYGSVPNGTRSPGDGARKVGRMIFPAFGGILEGVESQQQPELGQGHVPPPIWHRFTINKKTGDITGEDGKPHELFSSKQNDNVPKKLVLKLR